MKQKTAKRTNVNSKQNYSKFGEHLHYLTLEKLQVLWESVDDSRDKLILKLIFELGCRVGEFTKIQLKHINFQDCSIFFPAENTKTRERRTSFIPRKGKVKIVQNLGLWAKALYNLHLHVF